MFAQPRKFSKRLQSTTRARSMTTCSAEIICAWLTKKLSIRRYTPSKSHQRTPKQNIAKIKSKKQSRSYPVTKTISVNVRRFLCKMAILRTNPPVLGSKMCHDLISPKNLTEIPDGLNCKRFLVQNACSPCMGQAELVKH